MIDIRRLPLALIEALHPHLKTPTKDYIISEKAGYLIYFKDADPTSSFYFGIKSVERQSPNYYAATSIHPYNKYTVSSVDSNTSVNEIEKVFGLWLVNIQAYRTISKVLEADPIIEEYQDQYFIEFDLVDDPANHKPLTTKGILQLDKHLDLLLENLSNYKSVDNAKEIDGIAENIEQLRTELTTSSKIDIAQKVSKIWAKMTRWGGVKFVKELLTEVVKDQLKESLKNVITNPEKFIEIGHQIHKLL